MNPSEIRQKIGRFRILVIGRANAGKTTILQRVCNTRDNPEIFNSAGKTIDLAVLEASRGRGLHDIENEMVFRSNPGFVFHDSRGFEAGGESEFNKVKAFIAARSKETKIKNQLHAIWYCIPMDESSRSFTAGENKFFSQCDTGSIPVMVLFTKFDALYNVEYAKLREQGMPWKDAKELAPKRAEESFAGGSQLKFLANMRRPPRCHICLTNMDKDDADCGSLIERTAGTLDNEVLQQLFVSTQQTNLELCMKYAIERTLPTLFDSTETPTSQGHQEIIRKLGVWFPHIWVLLGEDVGDVKGFFFGFLGFFVSVLVLLRVRAMPIQLIGHRSQLDLELGIDVSASIHGLIGASLTNEHYWSTTSLIRRQMYEVSFFIVLRLRARLTEDVTHWQKLYASHRQEMWSRLLSVASGSSPLETILHLSSAVVIVFEHSFYIFDKRRHHRDQQQYIPSFYVALEEYMASPHATAVREGVSAAVQAYEEAVTTAARACEEAVGAAVYTDQETLPALMAKSPFEPFKKKKAKQSFERSKEKEKDSSCSQAKVECIRTILKITLDHRLSRP